MIVLVRNPCPWSITHYPSTWVPHGSNQLCPVWASSSFNLNLLTDRMNVISVVNIVFLTMTSLRLFL